MELIRETARNREGNMGPFNEDKVSEYNEVKGLFSATLALNKHEFGDYSRI